MTLPLWCCLPLSSVTCGRILKCHKFAYKGKTPPIRSQPSRPHGTDIQICSNEWQATERTSTYSPPYLYCTVRHNISSAGDTIIALTRVMLPSERTDMGAPYQMQVDATTSAKLNKTAADIVAATPMKPRRKPGPKEDWSKRREDLESDPMVAELTPISVKCRHCGDWITLDPRRKYYPFNWIKHRGRCNGKSKKKRVTKRTQVIVHFHSEHD